MKGIINYFRHETDEGVMDRFITAMLINQFHKLNMSEDSLRSIADKFFDDFEGCKGLTISRAIFVDKTTDRLLRIEREIKEQERLLS